ncbi:MAG: helix-turn-helix domain-containing protein [Thomasclavelia sp.]
MNKRLEYLRKDVLKITQSNFGEKIGLGKTAISKIENGTTILTERNIKNICREFNVNYSWLVYGEGEIFNTIEKTLIDRLADEFQLSQIQIRMIEAIMELNDEQINMFTSKFFGFEILKKDHKDDDF